MPHESERGLRMSLFTVPDVSIGRAPLTPQNSQFDQRRLDYLEGMTRYLNNLAQDLEKRHSQEEALSRLQKLIAQLPYSELVEIDATSTPSVRAIDSARDRVAFNQERLKISFLDGLGRGTESPAITAGTSSPDVCHVVSKLSQGISEDALSQILKKSSVGLAPVIDGLRQLKFIEEVDMGQPIVPKDLLTGEDDRLSWLGHACVLFQTSSTSICVDPFLRPHIRWTDRDLQSSFSDSFADRLFFEPYGPQVPQLSPPQLPRLDAVFVTHQDIDHFNLGVLMMLPEDVPIIVPGHRGNRMWEVNLRALIHKVLGKRRKVICLKHGETITIGNVHATAFPFFSEMPSSLKTSWNCYLFETENSGVACTADSAITDSSVDFLTSRLTGKRKPFVLCARLIHSGQKTAGYRDEIENLFNFTRLWPWYTPIWDLFQPVEELGISQSRFRTLCQRTNLRFYLPYAMGTAPWYRITDVNDPLHVPMANLSLRDVESLSHKLQEISGGPALFPGKFAKPVPLATA